jgi:hypothetical protein
MNANVADDVEEMLADFDQAALRPIVGGATALVWMALCLRLGALLGRLRATPDNLTDSQPRGALVLSRGAIE